MSSCLIPTNPFFLLISITERTVQGAGEWESSGEAEQGAESSETTRPCSEPAGPLCVWVKLGEFECLCVFG